jgi:hypothetical protein
LDKLPYHLRMSLRQLDDGLWVLEAPRDPSGLLPVRSTLLRLEGGGLMIVSALPGIDRQAEAVRALGPVRALVAPNVMHHLGLDDAAPAFPEATLWARPSLQSKRSDLKFGGTLGDAPDSLWATTVDQVVVGGMPRLDEVVFFHRPSRSLVLSDLCFHLGREESWAKRLFLRLNDAQGRFGPSRICRMLMADRGAVRAAVDRMLSWNPERLLVSHGEIVERGGRAMLEQAFAFLPRP